MKALGTLQKQALDILPRWGGEGLAMSLSVADNLVLGRHDDPQFRREYG